MGVSFAFVVNVCRFKCVRACASINLHSCTITVNEHGFAVNKRYIKSGKCQLNATVICVLCSTLLIVSTHKHMFCELLVRSG